MEIQVMRPRALVFVVLINCKKIILDIPVIFASQLNTTSDPKDVAKKEINPKPVESKREAKGTPHEVVYAKIFGAFPSSAMAIMVLEVAYRLEFPADKAAMRITAFIMWAALAKPTVSKARVNGVRDPSLLSLKRERRGSL